MNRALLRATVVSFLCITGCVSSGTSSRGGSVSKLWNHKSEADEQSKLAAREPSVTPAAASMPAAGPSGAPAATAAQTPQQSAIAQSLQMGADALKRGAQQEAKLHYERVLTLQPSNADAHHRLGIIYDQMRQFDASQQHYMAALAKDPSNADLLSDIGFSKFLQGRYDESERCLTDAIKVNPKHKQALNNLGLLYAKQGDYDRALATFRKAGTENEAQESIAKLFPSGRPGSDPFGPGAPPEGSTALASSTAPATDWPDNNVRDRPAKANDKVATLFDQPQITPRAQSRDVAQNGAPDDNWPQPKAAAVAGPTGQFDPAGTTAWNDPRQTMQPQPAQPNGQVDPRTGRPPGMNIPDAKLNQVFAEIDAPNRSGSRGNAPQASPPLIGAQVQAPIARQDQRGAEQLWGQATGSNVAHDRRSPMEAPSRPNVNPLDALPMWKPGDAQAENAVHSAAGEWPANAESPAPQPNAPIRQLGNTQPVESSQPETSPTQWPYSPHAVAQAPRADLGAQRDGRTPAIAFDSIAPNAAAPSGGAPVGAGENGSLDGAARAAARLGLSAGPGQMFPTMGVRPSRTASDPDPAVRSVSWNEGSATRGSYGAPPQGPSTMASPGQPPDWNGATVSQQYAQTASGVSAGQPQIRTAQWPPSAPQQPTNPHATRDPQAAAAPLPYRPADWPRSGDPSVSVPATSPPESYPLITPRGYQRPNTVGGDATDEGSQDASRQSPRLPAYDRTAIAPTDGTYGGTWQR